MAARRYPILVCWLSICIVVVVTIILLKIAITAPSTATSRFVYIGMPRWYFLESETLSYLPFLRHVVKFIASRPGLMARGRWILFTLHSGACILCNSSLVHIKTSLWSRPALGQWDFWARLKLIFLVFLCCSALLKGRPFLAIIVCCNSGKKYLCRFLYVFVTLMSSIFIRATAYQLLWYGPSRLTHNYSRDMSWRRCHCDLSDTRMIPGLGWWAGLRKSFMVHERRCQMLSRSCVNFWPLIAQAILKNISWLPLKKLGVSTGLPVISTVKQTRDLGKLSQSPDLGS